MHFLLFLAIFSAALLHPFGRKLLLTMFLLCVVGLIGMWALYAASPHPWSAS